MELSSETKGLKLLQKLGYEAIQSPDWLAWKDGRCVCLEVKEKELFEPGPNFPYCGCGLDKSQVYLRTKMLKTLGVRTILVNFVPGTNDFYYRYLDELEKGIFYDTRKGIRIYPIDNFKAIHDAPNQNLGGLG